MSTVITVTIIKLLTVLHTRAIIFGEQTVKKEGRKMTSRVPVTPETHTELQDFAYGLGVTFDDAIRVLLLEVADNEDRLSVGRRLRSKYQSMLKSQPKTKNKPSPN